MAGFKSTPPVWREALKVSMALFIPGFLLMIGGFFLLNPSLGRYLLDKDKTKIEDEVRLQITQEVKKQIQDETKKQIEVERTNILAGQKALLKLDKESPLGRTYVSREITIQAEEQAKKVAKEELSQAKGDLFGQITFPVIFAIASIFAAFAVKDVLTEILKREEKKELKDEIKGDLEKLIGVPNESKESLSNTSNTLWSITLEEARRRVTEITDTQTLLINNSKEMLEASINESREESKQKLAWIEYELASLSLYTESKIPKKYLNQHICRIHKAVEALIELDRDQSSNIKFLESYDNAYFCSITGERPEVSSCKQYPYNRVDILLARAKLTLSEIEKKEEFKDVLKFIENETNMRINDNKNQVAEMAYSDQYPELPIAPKRASAGS